jgi:Carboxypeptidase regulatory-like domain
MTPIIRRIRFTSVLVALAFAISPAVLLFAQVTGSALSGTITDASSAVVAGARVTIVNQSTEVTREAVTDKNGFYSAPNLLPGNYEVTVTATGFATTSRSGIRLNVGGDQVIDIQMKVGQVNQKVEVTEAAPILQLASSELSSVVDSRTVRELPLNGRSWTELAALQPGVVRLQSSFNVAVGVDRGLKGFSSQLSVSGGRPVQNNYRLDGISVNDYANGGPSNVLGGALGVDAIQEFSVITSNYTAQYGRTSGGVINAITRSGTNSFHGSAYEFLRNSVLDARNYFDYDPNGNPYRAPFRRNQFGASAGGPIVKNHTFIFGDYEGIRQSKGIATQAIVPSSAARMGNLSTGQVTVDPSAAKYLVLYPIPNVPTNVGGDTGIYSFTGQQALNEDFFTTRIDDTLSEKDSLSGTYLFDNTPYSAPDQMDVTLYGHHIRRQMVVLEESHAFSPALLNAVHIGGSRVAAAINQAFGAVNHAATDTSLAAVPGRNPARIFMNGYTLMPGGVGGTAAVVHGYTSLQGYDDAFWTLGTHDLKFGAAVENIANNTDAQPGTGDWTFGSISDFLTNQPLSFVASLNAATPRDVRQTIFGAYFQDNWRFRRNLTIDLGLRYEMATTPSEIHGKYVSLLQLTDAQPKVGGQLFHNPTLRNFEPRLGFAWDPRGAGKTVVHGAFGVFDVLPLPYVFDLLEANAAPFTLAGSVVSGLQGTFYAGGYPLLTPQTLNTTFVQQHPGRNYAMTWNLNVQHELTPSLAVIVGYVGSRAVHQQFKVDDADMTLPTLTPYGYLFPYSAAGPLPTLNPNFGGIHSLWWNGGSSYNGLQIGVTKQMSKGVQLQGSYTWSKSLDTSSSGAGSDSYANSLSSLHWYDQRLNKSVSDYNTPRVLSLSAIWDIPKPSVFPKLGDKVLGGWQLGSIFLAQDGQPFTALVGGDPLGQNSSDPFAFPDRLSGQGCKSLVNPGNLTNYIKLQCFTMPTAPSQAFYNQNCNPTASFPTCLNLLGNARRNILAGPGLANLDFAVYKNTSFKLISESFNTQFRVEFFNVLNHPNFQSPLSSNTLFDPSGNPQSGAGTILQTTTDSREIQLALKIAW